MSRNNEQSPSARSLMAGISALYAYIYCLLASNELTSIPIFGGAMYICGQVSLEFFAAAIGPASSLLPNSIRRMRRGILALLMLLSLFLMVIYPMRLSSFQLWTVLLIVLAMIFRDEVAKRLVQMRVWGNLRVVWFSVLLAAAHIIPALAVLWDFLYNLDPPRAWTMFAAYGIADALALYVHLRDLVFDRELEVSESSVEQISELQASLDKANAFRAYQSLSTAIVISLVVTVVLMFTNLLLAGENMLAQMGIAVATTLVTTEAASLLFQLWEKRKNRKPNPTYVMLFGLLIWFSGLNSFRTLIWTGNTGDAGMYLDLGIVTAGSTLVLTAMRQMEESISNVARYVNAGMQRSSFLLVRYANIELSRLMGNMISLIIIAIMFYFSGHGPQNAMDLFEHIQPLLLIPALIMVFVSAICAFRFPLSKDNMDKLDRFLHLREEGKSNHALQSQIEQIAMHEHRQPFGTALVKFVVRVFYHHKIKGRENIILDDDNPLIFLCNHGDIYGPLACASSFPVPMRPWVISQVCTTVDVFADYFCTYNLRKLPIPESWKHPIAEFVGRLTMWCMRQLDVIPVYRDHPMELIKTFRASVEALQAGDNILIFPENPNALEKDHGYEHEGLGPLFEGFMMLATIYYKRTGKACRFLPMYAHKGTRTLCFGHEVDYNPKAEDDDAERLRVVQECEKEMRRLMTEQDALKKKKNRKK